MKSLALPAVKDGDIANRRILRLALGTALSLWCSQLAAWPLSFMAPVFTMFLLSVPLPMPSLQGGIKLVLALMLPLLLTALSLLPFLEHLRSAGILLVALALFYSFYFTSRGGSPVLGTFITLSLTLVVTMGSVSIDMLLIVAQGLALGAVFGLVFVWIAHGLLPDLKTGPSAANAPVPPKPEPGEAQREARRKALRATAITFPMTLIFLLTSASPSYVAVMMKVATMGQQASVDNSRELGRSMLESTLWGGIGAVIAWQVLSIWPSLLMYTLLIGLAGLLFGPRIFKGGGMHPKFSMWSYAFLTMIVILAPAVLDSQSGSAAGAAFYSRLFLFMVIAVYGSVAVAVFDAFWPTKETIGGQ
ncbi:MAG: DUF2955 domain-containing protein [Gammaproteobacteria bacterium]|nr:DUF2955 domain-containing protein [Gammaproteobacteria bacterium]MBQ0839683.1 DUF2955 domain-containing protein [Gammaproteobacteria bacterium]